MAAKLQSCILNILEDKKVGYEKENQFFIHGFIHSSVKRAYCSSLSDLGYKKRKCSLKEHDNIVKSKYWPPKFEFFNWQYVYFKASVFTEAIRK